MIRTIIQIDEDKCDGCGLCVSACHEGALGLVDGKVKLLRDDYCDGMGDCLPACPAGAITFIEREAAAYDEAAVQAHMTARADNASTTPCEGGCAVNLDKLIESLSALSINPAAFVAEVGKENEGLASNSASEINADKGGSSPSAAEGAFEPRATEGEPSPSAAEEAFEPCATEGAPLPSDIEGKPEAAAESSLRNWPVQIKLSPTSAPYFAGCDLLIAADCTAFAHAGFHAIMAGRVTLIGCPKLDSIDYAEKLAGILALNDIRSITVARMQVPCCGGIELAARRASAASGKNIPIEVITISTQGEVL